jgi:hypothetical protein
MRSFRLFRAPGETETTQENLQYWLKLDGERPCISASERGKIAALTGTTHNIKFSIYLFSKFFVF